MYIATWWMGRRVPRVVQGDERVLGVLAAGGQRRGDVGGAVVEVREPGADPADVRGPVGDLLLAPVELVVARVGRRGRGVGERRARPTQQRDQDQERHNGP